MKPLYLKRGEDKRLRTGHLWIFSNEVDVNKSPLRDFEPGEPALVRDAAGRPLGTAYVNPASLICARLLSKKALTPDRSFLYERLFAALRLRETLYSEPYYRLCFGEGDFLPGLVADRFNDVLVVQIATAGMERLKEHVIDVLDELIRPSILLLRNDIPSRTLEGLELHVESAIGPAPDALPETLMVRENGLTFAAPFIRGQKTGWFFDQRDNHALTRPFAAGARVLDAFSYAGGFGATAAAAGAKSVTFLDASETALDYALKNARHNAPECAAAVLSKDALDTLANLREEGAAYDIVCLDPPAFIKRKKDAENGLAAYRRVNELAMDLVADRGILVTCSCSQHLEAGELRRIAVKAAAKRGRRIQLLRAGAQGPDHPVHPAMPETAYLKALVLRVFRSA